jgi:hypothetical protein
MKSLIAPMLASASFATFLICGMVAASSLRPSYAPHKFENLEAGIWTSGPVRVDTSTQPYERVAAVQSPALSSQTFALKDPISDHSPDISTSGLDDARPKTADVAVGGDLCKQRYKSYRASDNTYQPLSGGPRRQCDMGITAVAKPDRPANTVAENGTKDHGAWCQSRYSSYDPTDDTYQPLGGGNRKLCTSPSASGISG